MGESTHRPFRSPQHAQRLAEIVLLALAALVSGAGPASAQTNLRAWNEHGQTWLVWTDDRSFVGLQTYDVYRSDTPIIEIADATLVGRIYPEDWRATRLRLTDPGATWSIPDGAGGSYRLAPDEALFVYTPHEASMEYFAVVRSGFDTVGPANSTGPVAQSLDPIICHLQLEGVTSLGYPYRIWAHWVDGRNDHGSGRSDYPVMANAGSNGTGHVFAVWEPPGGLPPGLLPAVIQLHGGRGNYTNWVPLEGRTAGKLDNSVPGGFDVALDDVSFVADEVLGLPLVTAKNTWWFGYWENYDRFTVPAGPPPDESLVVDYTVRRVEFILDWLRDAYPIDPDRVSIMGQSMGGFGASSLSRRFPEHFSAATAFCAPYAGHVRDPFIDRLIGTREQNLPTTLPGGRRMTDWSRHETLLPASPDLPFIRYVQGKNDESVPWLDESGDSFPATMQAVDALRMGQSFDWDERAHQIPDWAGHWVGSPRHDAAWLAAQRRDRSFPALSGVDHDPELAGPQPDPGDGPPASGDPFGTWGGYVEWDRDTLSDTIDRWAVDLFLRGSSEFTADASPFPTAQLTVTPRRRQAFKPAPESDLFWTLRDLISDEVVSSGATTATAGAAIHLGPVEIARDPERRRLAVTLAVDDDDDGYDAQIDCDDTRADVWSLPGAVQGLVFESRDELAWTRPDEPGADPSVLGDDLLRTLRPDNFLDAATCVATGLLEPHATDASRPDRGEAFFYLARTVNPCGAGPLGAGRIGRECSEAAKGSPSSVFTTGRTHLSTTKAPGCRASR